MLLLGVKLPPPQRIVTVVPQSVFIDGLGIPDEHELLGATVAAVVPLSDQENRDDVPVVLLILKVLTSKDSVVQGELIMLRVFSVKELLLLSMSASRADVE